MDEIIIEGTNKIAQDGFMSWFDGLGLRDKIAVTDYSEWNLLNPPLEGETNPLPAYSDEEKERAKENLQKAKEEIWKEAMTCNDLWLLEKADGTGPYLLPFETEGSSLYLFIGSDFGMEYMKSAYPEISDYCTGLLNEPDKEIEEAMNKTNCSVIRLRGRDDAILTYRKG